MLNPAITIHQEDWRLKNTKKMYTAYLTFEMKYVVVFLLKKPKPVFSHQNVNFH